MEVESSEQKQKKRINDVSTRGHGSGAMGFTTTTAFASPQVDPDLDFCMEHRRPFGDVDSSTSHSKDIEWMYCNGITTGFRDPGSYPVTYSYKGMNTVIRQDMAAFLRRMASRQKIGNAVSWKPSSSDWNRFRDVGKNTPHTEDVRMGMAPQTMSQSVCGAIPLLRLRFTPGVRCPNGRPIQPAPAGSSGSLLHGGYDPTVLRP